MPCHHTDELSQESYASSFSKLDVFMVGESGKFAFGGVAKGFSQTVCGSL